MRQIDLARLKKSREVRVEIGEIAIIHRRPSDADLARIGVVQMDIDFAMQYVVGWEGVKESDLLPGGDPEPVAYNAEAFKIWIEDRPDLWSALSKSVIESYTRHASERAERGKG